MQGLAHFCEHLLFMGTEKYRKENDYNQYLSEHSGFSNAFTGVENTNYYFEVGHEYLEGALDRFAQFFIAPLFSASCTERELKAVDSGWFYYVNQICHGYKLIFLQNTKRISNRIVGECSS